MDNIEQLLKPTPRERLELTREALARQMARRRRRAPLPEDPALAQQQGMLARVRRAGRAWWQSHPAHDAVDFARPALEDYAEQKPYRLVGIAAGAGVALTLLRAWRIVPLTGVAFALMKSSDLKATVRSFAAAPRASTTAHPRQEDHRFTRKTDAPQGRAAGA